MPFHYAALFLISLWLLVVVVRFRRSTAMLAGGLVAIGLGTAVAVVRGDVAIDRLGLAAPASWALTVGFALGWLALMLAYSPVADRIATWFVATPPNLAAFRGLQESRLKLLLGILAAWILGGFLEELAARGIALQAIDMLVSRWASPAIALSAAIVLAAIGAGLLHLYQGLRAILIVTQLSVLFGVLFVISGRNLWAVVLCHGLYDTIAFVRFAAKASKYAKLDNTPPSDAAPSSY